MSETDTIADITSMTELKMPSMWTVVFLNDDFTPMQFVTQLLMSVFYKSSSEAEQITMEIHHEGRARVGVYTREVACNKADRAMMMAGIAQHPLQVYAERL